ncbi:MAG: YqiA/YcfP family alpha/beta fold hydrolase [Lamprobacter sp.]|uniref:YqiA/YcfP family alpha/beta fold hydrolase n=1 Tax=Lamprobacter sp. TaxID=3100796 RepID=UPI002B25C0A9|nr:YqiA/YcfP family alpha/beta fold hydrolase [Lamprobacter sp.]MEA3642998.1 YqiA/YcfP family alpha/beta fold hydrolase [Lamprobacter sp.]MEA3643608.1 YqiA/YcfP family alpha/beta fold hydrolase [Lamprobacter sp.]
MALILYLHGFASGPKPNSPKVDLLRALGHEVRCLATQGGYRPEDYLRAAEAALSKSPTFDLLVGSSLGGFWARYLGARQGYPWIGLNPALRPSATLAGYQGRLQRFDVEANFDWTLEDALAYRAYEQEPPDPSVPGLILVAADDEVVDAQETQALASGSALHVLAQGGHELANTAAYADAVADFITRVTARRGA